MNKFGILLLSIFLGPVSCSSLARLDPSLNTEGVDFGATVATFPEYRKTGLPVPVIPLTQQRIDDEIERVRETARNAPKPPEVKSTPYTVGALDALSVVVWDHPELSSPVRQDAESEAPGYQVSEDGTMFFPYVGKFEVAGMTASQIREKLTQLLAAEIQSPQLDVSILDYRSKSVFIAGEVANPGLQAITDKPLTILDAISNAGGLNNQADLSQTTLSRNNKTYTLNLNELFLRGDTAQNMLLIDGDVLTLPNTNDSNFYVLGKVRIPSIKTMTSQRITLAMAIEDAGKVFPVTPDRLVHYFVVRPSADGTLILHLDGASPDALILRNNFEIMARDIVYVVTSRPALWDLIYKQLLQYANVYSETPL